jgi:hypothetical protein
MAFGRKAIRNKLASMLIELHFPEFHLNPDVVTELDLPKVLQEEMLNVRTRIADDTAHGIKADGGGIKPYSESYIKQIDSGRAFGKEPGNHTPNLYAIGALMASMTVENLANGARMILKGTHPAKKTVSAKYAKTKQKRAVARGVSLGQRAERSASSTGSRGQGGGKTGTGRKRGSGGGGASFTNEQLAQWQINMGRDGWFAFAHARDKIRIVDRVRAAFHEAVKKLVVVK